jgi:hypothetical protein
MGLDMYLERRHYIGNTFKKQKERLKLITPKQQNATFPIPHIDSSKIDSIIEEVAYWRKANAIHNWFVQNVQDGEDNCTPHYVSGDQLKELLETVNKVLKNKDLAEELLPTAEGFFFGGTEYDRYYFDDLKSTKEILKVAIEEEKIGGDIYYCSSW